MRNIYCFLIVLLARQATCRVIRSSPAFAKPMYSDAYLPAAMQVIFHAVEQLKAEQAEVGIRNYTTGTSLSTSPFEHTTQSDQGTVQYSSTVATTPSTQSVNQTKGETEGDKIKESSKDKLTETKLEESSEEEVQDSKVAETPETLEIAEESIEDSSRRQETPEMNEETPETNYATPETNYESPEDVHAVQETNHEIPEEDQEANSSSHTAEETKLDGATGPTKASTIEEDEEKTKDPTIDSVVRGVYEILKPTPSEFLDEDVGSIKESRSTQGISLEKLESIEEEDDENRFTQLGERVTQVPRPSLSSYLRRSNVPPSATLQQLATLYDSLSKDAKKQGFGKYAGYSEEVLNTLETSAEGGIVSQLKKLLGKVLERGELTREDAKTKTSKAIRDLNDPSSTLNRELRPLLPLRYTL